MADEFHILEWLAGPESDLSAIGVRGRAAGEPVRVEDPADLGGRGNLVCFRLEELNLLRPPALAGLLERGDIADATWLARVAMPTQDSFEVEDLAHRLGIPIRRGDSADRARMAAEVWLGLLRRLAGRPLAVLLEMERLLEPTGHFLRGLVKQVAKDVMRRSFGRPGRSIEDLLPDDAREAGRFRRTSPREPPSPLDAAEVVSLFEPEGPLARRFAAYEYRPEQVRMVKEVCEAFNDGLVLLAEAGTGTGKSLAYLAPAILWSVRNEDPVVVSTNTKNLQAQLFQKDLPFLERALGGAFRYALIKGRANYLCVRKLLMLLGAADSELVPEERVELLPLVSWLADTKTGDVAENAGFAPGMGSELWGRLSSQPDECLAGRCRWSRRCFVRRARALAAQSDIVIANHATVFSEAGLENVALPAHRSIVFDEAHNLEDVVTDCFTVQVGPWQVPRVLNRLARLRRGTRGVGLLVSLQRHLERVQPLDRERREEILGLLQVCRRWLPEIRQANDALFAAVRLLFEGMRGQDDRIRYDADHRPENWPAVAEAASRLGGLLGGLADRLESMEQRVESLAGRGTGESRLRPLRETAGEVGSQAHVLRNLVESVGVVVRAEDEAFVYWAQRGPGRGEVSLCAAPLDITDLMHRAVYGRMRTVVFTSATLTVEGGFEFMRDRLGLRGEVSSRVRTVALGSSFDFPRQVLLAVPLFLPEPRTGGPDFVEPFCRLCVDLLRVTAGRGLVLFTSHAMLRRAAEAIRPALATHGIRVLVQGDGERARLAARFSRETSSVLLGTQSFWEGMDVPGEALSCLVLAKLPFRPHTDPIVSARCELLRSRGRNPFLEYMVPDAVMRLKQGFGRLVRTREDRGVVLLCDARAVTRPYGRSFRLSLPVQARTFADPDSLLAAVRDFLAAPVSPDPSCAAPPTAPWREEGPGR